MMMMAQRAALSWHSNKKYYGRSIEAKQISKFLMFFSVPRRGNNMQCVLMCSC
jgi:hypothetical protein